LRVGLTNQELVDDPLITSSCPPSADGRRGVIKYCNLTNYLFLIKLDAFILINIKLCSKNVVFPFIFANQTNQKLFIMIQRVQSIYLFLVFIVAVVLIFFPLATFHTSDHIFQMNIMGFSGAENLDLNLPNVMAIGILTALLGMLSLFTIFQFKNRKLQMKLNMGSMLINFGLLAAIFIYSDNIAAIEGVNSTFSYDVAAYFPIVSVLLLILANRNIRADEKLVRQSERLR
jgi:hypothetical protein